jgi:hypothetical protein
MRRNTGLLVDSDRLGDPVRSRAMLPEQDPHAQRKSMSQESEHDAGPFCGTVNERGRRY